MGSNFKQLPALMAAGALWCAGTSAYAQSSGPSADSSQGSGMEEIIVTAQRRSERLEDVPMSINALSRDTLTQSGVTNTQDLAQVVPGLGMTLQGAWLQPSIRGVTSVGSNLGDNSNVAMYIDGVYQPQQIATLTDLPDIEQIEVLKGPQGALYGQNATGGAILINSLAPSFTPSGRFSASYGNFQDVQLRAYVTGPLTDKIAGSLSGGTEDRDGFRTQVLTGERDHGLKSRVLRGKLLFEPAEWAKITVTGFYTDRTYAPFAGVPYQGNSAAYGFFPDVPRALNPRDNYEADPRDAFRLRSYGGSIVGDFDTGNGRISTITSVSRNKQDYTQADVDFTVVNYAVTGPSDANAEYFIQEVNYTSDKIGPVTFLTGVFYLDGHEEFTHNRFDIFAPTLPPSPPGIILFGDDTYGLLQKQIYAVYADATVDVTHDFIMTAGARYSSETQHGFANSASTGGITPIDDLTVIERPGGAVTFSNVSPRVTAKYVITPDSNVYASFSKGFKSGLINTDNLAQPPVNPEIITAYEVGYKGRPLESVTFNASAFWYNYKGLQFTAYDPPVFITQNAASARIKGVDIDTSWAITRQFSLSGGVEYLDNHYVSFPDAAVFLPIAGGGNNQATANLSGQRMLRSPKLTGNITGNYSLDTGIGQFGAFATIYHTTSYGFDNALTVVQPSYTTINGDIHFSPIAFEKLRVSLWGKNLTNRAYYAQAIETQFGSGVTYADPRTFGIRAEYSF